MVSQSLSALLSLCSLAFCALPQLDGSFYLHELDYLASLGSRLTGSANQALLINHIRRELQNLGFHVYSDNYNFQYQRPPSDPINLTINGESVPASGFVPYAGVTDAEGVEGRLVEIEVPESFTESPDWSLAAGNIALVNLYNTPLDGANRFPVWHGSSKWSGTIPGIPATNPGVRNISLATEAGVKGIIYNWKNITSFNAYAQYGPFKQNDQGTPAIYVTDQALRQVQARNGSRASFTSNGAMINDTHTETIWVVIEGTNLKNETVLINTHTDGCNVVQENGYIPMLARARELAHSPPCRTTILLFLSGHLHTSGFTDKGRITERWLEDHPDLWAESSGSGKKAVFGSCVEHLGAAHWKEDLPNELYYPTGAVEDELLYASSQKLADMIGGFWKGADPDVLRIVNPHAMSSEQSGEGLAYLWHDIPEVSICTAPDWLLKVFPPTFDQMSLVDVKAVRRQSESLLKLWGAVDHLSSEDIRHL